MEESKSQQLPIEKMEVEDLTPTFPVPYSAAFDMSHFNTIITIIDQLYYTGVVGNRRVLEAMFNLEPHFINLTKDEKAMDEDPSAWRRKIFLTFSRMQSAKLGQSYCLQQPDVVDRLVLSPEFLEGLGLGPAAIKALKLDNSVPLFNREDVKVHPIIHSTPPVAVLDAKTLTNSSRETLKRLKKSRKRSSGKNGRKLLANNLKDFIDEDTVVARKYGAEITIKHIRTLEMKQELQDIILDFGLMDMLTNHESREKLPVVILETWVSKALDSRAPLPYFIEKTYKLAISRLGNSNLSTVSCLVIPHNLEGAHWVLAIFCNPFPSEQDVQEALRCGGSQEERSRKVYEKWIHHLERPPVFMVFDSLLEKMRESDMIPEHFHAKVLQQVKPTLFQLHKSHWKSRGADIRPIQSYIDIVKYPGPRNIPGQDMQSKNDCGIFCIQYLSAWITLMQKFNGKYNRVTDDMLTEEVIAVRNKITRKSIMTELYTLCRNQKSVAAPIVRALHEKFFPNEDVKPFIA